MGPIVYIYLRGVVQYSASNNATPDVFPSQQCQGRNEKFKDQCTSDTMEFSPKRILLNSVNHDKIQKWYGYHGYI